METWQKCSSFQCSVSERLTKLEKYVERNEFAYINSVFSMRCLLVDWLHEPKRIVALKSMSSCSKWCAHRYIQHNTKNDDIVHSESENWAAWCLMYFSVYYCIAYTIAMYSLCVWLFVSFASTVIQMTENENESEKYIRWMRKGQQFARMSRTQCEILSWSGFHYQLIGRFKRRRTKLSMLLLVFCSVWLWMGRVCDVRQRRGNE